jgi:hypothetical protein
VTLALEHRLDALQRIYAIHDQVLASYDLACRQGCDPCCTANVTLTGLEALRIVEGLGARCEPLIAPMLASRDPRRFRPAFTINAIAAMALAGEDSPEEGADPEAGSCPLLADRRCAIYPLRPFACRCMVSTRPCTKGGYATIDDFLVTVNTVFQQVIEHLDAGGCTGNLSDVLPLLSQPDILADCQRGRWGCRASALAANQPMPALMVPPEHRARLAPILDALQRIRLGQTPSTR